MVNIRKPAVRGGVGGPPPPPPVANQQAFDAAMSMALPSTTANMADPRMHRNNPKNLPVGPDLAPGPMRTPYDDFLAQVAPVEVASMWTTGQPPMQNLGPGIANNAGRLLEVGPQPPQLGVAGEVTQAQLEQSRAPFIQGSPPLQPGQQGMNTRARGPGRNSPPPSKS